MSQNIQHVPHTFFSSIPFKRIFTTITLILVFLLVVILSLGVRQFFLYRQFSEVTTAFDHILFEFTAVNNSITTLLVSNETNNISELRDELTSINSDVVDLTQEIVVPDYLKSMLTSKSDLIGILTDLQTINIYTETISKKQEFISKLNAADVGFQSFHTALRDHKQHIFDGLHNMIIGLLGMSLVCCCGLLFTINSYIFRPLIKISALLKENELLNQETKISVDGMFEIIHALIVAPRKSNPAITISQWDYIVSGKAAVQTAHTTANLINISLNQLQQLIDITEEGKYPGYPENKLKEILKQEKKIIVLIKAMSSSFERPKEILPADPVRIYMDTVCHALSRHLASKNIQLKWDKDVPEGLLVRSDIFRIALLSIIHLAEYSLETVKSGPREIRFKWYFDSDCEFILQCTIAEAKFNMGTLSNSLQLPSIKELNQLVEPHKYYIKHESGSNEDEKIIFSIPVFPLK